MTEYEWRDFVDFMKDREHTLEERVEKGENRTDVDYSDLEYQRGRKNELSFLIDKVEKFRERIEGESGE